MNIAVFASGSGTNAENIVKYFSNNDNINISLIITNKKDAFVIERAKKLGVDYKYISKTNFENENLITNILKEYNIDFIVLSGFLLLVPDYLVNLYKNKIINIHPALLPKYGGIGMYGTNVHKAVIENKEKESGITIHYVNNEYDKGDIIFQAKCDVLPSDTPETLAEKVHKLEYEFFPKIIEKTIQKHINIE